MLQPIMHVLSNQRIILASGSPRRKLLLENIGLKIEVIPSNIEENLTKDDFDSPSDYCKETARIKGLDIAGRLVNDNPCPDLIISADTVVSVDGEIFEKPKDRQDAYRMLSGFSGKSHIVHTGVVLIKPLLNEQHKMVSFTEETSVNFATFTPEIINAYIDTGEPMDKAGGFGIQAIGGTLVTGVNGDFFNVMGFPLHKFAKELLIFQQDTTIDTTPLQQHHCHMNNNQSN